MRTTIALIFCLLLTGCAIKPEPIKTSRFSFNSRLDLLFDNKPIPSETNNKFHGAMLRELNGARAKDAILLMGDIYGPWRTLCGARSQLDESLRVAGIDIHKPEYQEACEVIIARQLKFFKYGHMLAQVKVDARGGQTDCSESLVEPRVFTVWDADTQNKWALKVLELGMLDKESNPLLPKFLNTSIVFIHESEHVNQIIHTHTTKDVFFSIESATMEIPAALQEMAFVAAVAKYMHKPLNKPINLCADFYMSPEKLRQLACAMRTLPFNDSDDELIIIGSGKYEKVAEPQSMTQALEHGDGLAFYIQLMDAVHKFNNKPTTQPVMLK